jgi:hypothetical protein
MTIRVAALATVVVLAVGGCSVPTHHDLRIANANALAKSDRALAVDIENYRGSVVVEVLPGLTKPTLQAWVLDETKGFMRVTDDVTVRSWYAAEVASVQGRPVLRILTKRTNETKPSSVRLVVQTPSCDGIRVRNSGGEVRLLGISGEVTVENGYKGGEGGGITVSTNRRLADAVSLRTTKGVISLMIPTNSQGRLDLNTPKGSPEVNVRGDGLDNVKKTLTGFAATLNNGVKPWTLLSAEGDIRVEVGSWEPTVSE